jgi:hypothetical protein
VHNVLPVSFWQQQQQLPPQEPDPLLNNPNKAQVPTPTSLEKEKEKEKEEEEEEEEEERQLTQACT